MKVTTDSVVTFMSVHFYVIIYTQRWSCIRAVCIMDFYSNSNKVIFVAFC